MTTLPSLTFRRSLPGVGTVVAVGLLSAVVALFQHHARGEAEASRWVDHSHEVIEQLLTIASALGRAESALRDDAGARDQRYLEGVRSALDEAAAGNARVRKLIADNPPQLRQLDQLDTWLRRRVSSLGRRQAAVREGLDPGTAPEAPQLSLQLRGGVEGMIASERVLLHERAIARAHEARRVHDILTAGLAGTAILVAAAMALVVRQTQLHHRAQLEAAAKHGLFLSIIESSSDAVFAKDLVGRYVVINTAGARLLDLTPEEMIGKDDGQLLSPDTGASVMQLDREILRLGKMGTYEQVATSKGVRRIYLTTKGPRRDPSGRIVGIIGISRDITERQAAEASRLQGLNLHLRLSEMLQACRGVEEAYGVIAQAAPRFFARQAGALYLFHASRDHLDSHVTWADDGKVVGEQTFRPDDCWALRRGQIHLFDGSGLGISCKHAPNDDRRAALCVPLTAHGEVLGVLHLRSTTTIDLPVVQEATVVAEQVAMALANLQLREELRNQSIRDPLTGLYNRRYAQETLRRELHRAERNGESLALLAIDVDHFKRFNDSFGHEGGDLVLRELGALLIRSVRGGDVASRMGGEELLIILVQADLVGASKRAEQIRASVSQLQIKNGDRGIGAITISIGLAVFPQHGERAEDLLRAADAALYQAKHQGRDRVVVAELPEPKLDPSGPSAPGFLS